MTGETNVLDEATDKPPELTDKELQKMDTRATFYSGCEDPIQDRICRDVVTLITELRRLRAENEQMRAALTTLGGMTHE